MAKKHNVVWIFVDSVRRRHSSPEEIRAGDDRSRLQLMDDFAEESVEFLNTVTSAPSTQMSLAAMACSYPAYFLARSFTESFATSFTVPSLTDTLRGVGYGVYGILQHRVNREFNVPLFTHIERKYWPKGLTHSAWWSNDDTNRAIERTLEVGVEGPSFFFVNYNCRNDPQTSDKVRHGLNLFRSHNFTEANTITILCSDHGYPAFRSEAGRPEFYQRTGLTHDLVLSDDNIMVPLSIQYPGCKKGLKVDTLVSLIDVFPTVLELVGVRPDGEIAGRSLIPLAEDLLECRREMEDRLQRVDNRFVMQKGKATAIRGACHKYVFHHDELTEGGKKEEFFDIAKDPLEQANLIDSVDETVQSEVDRFRDAYRASENDAICCQTRHLLGTFKEKYADLLAGDMRILVLNGSEPLFVKMLLEVINELATNTRISVLVVEGENEPEFGEDVVRIEVDRTTWDGLDHAQARRLVGRKPFDLLIVPISDDGTGQKKTLIQRSKKFPARKKLYLDYNVVSYKRPFLGPKIRRLRSAAPFIRQEPGYLIHMAAEYLAFGAKRLRGTLGSAGGRRAKSGKAA